MSRTPTPESLRRQVRTQVRTTIDPTHNTYATLGELHLDREQDLFCDVRVCAGALAALPRAPATWNDGVDGALLCDLLFSLHDDQANGAMQVLAVLALLLTGYTPASAAASSRVSMRAVGHGLLD